MRQSYSITVAERSQAGEARRIASNAAARLGFTATQQGRVSIVASELASNLAKHTGGGELIVQEISAGRDRGLELLAVDSGPGIADPAKVLRDGYSTAGSPGTGLGAVQRLSKTFDFFSVADQGSVFLSRIWGREGVSPLGGEFEYGVVSVSYPGEDECGDSWIVAERSPGKWVIVMVDGLGHGRLAAEAAASAVDVARRGLDNSPERIIELAHAALRSTRGAAMAVALVDFTQQKVEYAGVGNTVAALLGEGTRRMISYDGTVGHGIRKIQQLSYPWPDGGILVMHSDGLSANWKLERYPGLLARDPAVIAAVLFRDNRRRNDDATVLVARRARG
jgi:anti-sigma regulatory factor (Ser/Thr protein kinase)